MGVHSIEHTVTVSRVLGRGAVATSAALALAGSGGGLALATPGHDHGDDGDSTTSSHSSSHPVSYSSSDGHRSATICDTDHGGLVGGLLGDLGLDESTRSQARCDDQGSDGESSGSPTTSTASRNTDDGQQQASSSSSARRTPQSNPANEPPEPGETAVLRIPVG